MSSSTFRSRDPHVGQVRRSSGPTSVSANGAEIDNFGTIIVSRTITADEAGLTLITATANVKDMDGSQGGSAKSPVP